MMAGLHPHPGEGRVVDQACLGQPAENRLRSLRWHGVPPQGLLELGPGARRRSQQTQAQRHALGLGILAGGRRGPAHRWVLTRYPEIQGHRV
jgi:hypothetical protein